MGYSAAFFNIASGPTPSISSDYLNGTGLTLGQTVPVSIDASGNIHATNVSLEEDAENWVGLTSISIAATAIGMVVSDGRVQNIAPLGFAIGDSVWVGLNGVLTNVRPDLTQPGWLSGYWVLFVGVVVQNQFNPSQQDIQLMRQIVGQL